MMQIQSKATNEQTVKINIDIVRTTHRERVSNSNYLARDIVIVVVRCRHACAVLIVDVVVVDGHNRLASTQ